MKPYLVILCLAGCGGGGDDDVPMIDAASTNLTLAWTSRPESIPAMVESGVWVDSVVFDGSNLRVIGDAGPVAVGPLQLRWGMEHVPLIEVPISNAPSGLYSRCLFDLTAPTGGWSYQIMGRVLTGNTATPFWIRDTATHPISIEFSEMLMPGGKATIELRVRIDHLVEAVDFSQVTPTPEGALVIESGPQLERVRDELEDAFDDDDD